MQTINILKTIFTAICQKCLHVVFCLYLGKWSTVMYNMCDLWYGSHPWMSDLIYNIQIFFFFLNLWLWHDWNDSSSTCLQLLGFLLLYKERDLNWHTSLGPSGTANGVSSSRRWCEISHSVTGCSLLGLVRRLRVFPCCSNCSQSATCAGRLMCR